ncbi:MAG: hypothetical protein ACJ8C4_09840 [Gemmataceae bacterium]
MRRVVNAGNELKKMVRLHESDLLHPTSQAAEIAQLSTDDPAKLFCLPALQPHNCLRLGL